MPTIPPPFLFSATKAYRVKEFSFFSIVGPGVRTAGVTPATGGTSFTMPSRITVDTGAAANRVWEWCEYVHEFSGLIPPLPGFWSSPQEISCYLDSVTSTTPQGDSVIGVCLGSSKITIPYATGFPLNGLGGIQARFNFVTGNFEILIYDDGAPDVLVETCAIQPADIGAAQRHLKLFFNPGAGAFAQVYVDGTLIHTSVSTRLAAVGVGSGPDSGPGIFCASGSNAASRMQGSFAHVRSVWYQNL